MNNHQLNGLFTDFMPFNPYFCGDRLREKTGFFKKPVFLLKKLSRKRSIKGTIKNEGNYLS
ncbi:hypothetical protein [Microcystis aeruginosa]|uniref:hypothetical protein n=1 Tax=Microcystis aeruginosa TaxID=1126 RepID=UPI0012303C9E|nr:hypothetical protein [Microcystis aeruginosa]